MEKNDKIRWMLRPVIWFVTAYMAVIVFHEAAHAVTSVMLGFPATLFNFWVNHQFGGASASERAIVGIAGPTVSLFIGLLSWGIYRQIKNSAGGLPFLYLAAFGLTNFFGNLMSVAFFGDFSNAAVVLGLPQGLRIAAAIIGAISVAGILFATGRELWHWTPDGVGRLGGAIGLIVLPSLIGMTLVILINQPTPMGPSFASARAGEGAFWLFAVIGFLSTKQGRSVEQRPFRLHWADGAIAIFVLLAVRIMAQGILLTN